MTDQPAQRQFEDLVRVGEDFLLRRQRRFAQVREKRFYWLVASYYSYAQNFISLQAKKTLLYGFTHSVSVFFSLSLSLLAPFTASFLSRTHLLGKCRFCVRDKSRFDILMTSFPRLNLMHIN